MNSSFARVLLLLLIFPAVSFSQLNKIAKSKKTTSINTSSQPSSASTDTVVIKKGRKKQTSSQNLSTANATPEQKEGGAKNLQSSSNPKILKQNKQSTTPAAIKQQNGVLANSQPVNDPVKTNKQNSKASPATTTSPSQQQNKYQSSTAQKGTKVMTTPSSPSIQKPDPLITREKKVNGTVVNGLNQGQLLSGLNNTAARKAALDYLVGMGCTILPDNPAGVFCKRLDQFNKAFEYLEKGNIDDVQGDLSTPPTLLKLIETETNTGTLTITSTPTLYISKSGSTPRIVGSAGFRLQYPVPVLGVAPGCDPNNKALTDDQYNRRLIKQENYRVEYRNYGLFSYASAAEDGVMTVSTDVTDVDVIRAINYANTHNSWGQTFYLDMVIKAGPTFFYPDPVCTQSSSGVFGVNKEYHVTDNSQLLRPYRIVHVQLKVVSSL